MRASARWRTAPVEMNCLASMLRSGRYLTIYTADAAKLDELPLPAPREIAYFYAQIASIQYDLTRLATEPVSEGSAGSRTERIRRVLTELNDALYLGDDILRELRQLLSPKHQKSLTRA
jgi:hypothetical protein